MTDRVFYTIYKGGQHCVWCLRAADLLFVRGLDYVTKELPIPLLRAKANAARMNTVPIIYHGTTLIGGYEDLKTHLLEGDPT